jgi:hypothetical protein
MRRKPRSPGRQGVEDGAVLTAKFGTLKEQALPATRLRSNNTESFIMGMADRLPCRDRLRQGVASGGRLDAEVAIISPVLL